LKRDLIDAHQHAHLPHAAVVDGEPVGKNNRTLLPASVARTTEAVSISAPAAVGVAALS